jgi:hypothetical protein
MMAEAPGKGLSVNKINKKMRNKILSIHAAWLFNNGYYDESIDCLNQAKKYSQDKDLRQISDYFKRLKRTGVQIMPRAIPCTSSDDPERGSLGAFAPAGVRARKL